MAEQVFVDCFKRPNKRTHKMEMIWIKYALIYMEAQIFINIDLNFAVNEIT